MPRGITLSSSKLGFEEIAEHYSDIEKSIILYYSTGNPEFKERFNFYTKEEIATELGDRIQETDSATAMTLLATIEASFRVDYLQRCFRRKKDRLSREFRKLYKNKQKGVSLEKDILELWKIHSGVPASLVLEIRGALKYRHWLAHGRYWVPKFGQSYDFLNVFNLANEINQVFDLEQ